MAETLTGKASYITVAGTNLYFTKLTPKVTRKLADDTDSGNYNATDDLLYPSQLEVSAPVEIAVEGNYRKSQTPTAIIARLFTASGPYAVTFGVLTGYPHFAGNYDLSDFQIEDPLDDVVKWTATLKSNGRVSPNS